MIYLASLFLGFASPLPAPWAGEPVPPPKSVIALESTPTASLDNHPLPALAPALSTARTEAAFGRLKSLVGEWRVADRPDGALRISFSMTAGDTVLVERWERAGRPHSLTLYHRSGEALVATHYCPQGNQPRLALVATDGDALRFAFRNASDLDAGESYLHDLGFDLFNPARPVRRETYRNGDKEEASSLALEPA